MRLNGFLLLLFSLACCADQEQAGSGTLIDKEDSVYLPLLNAFGDTVLTGEEIQVTGKKRSLNELMNVRVVQAGKPVVIPAHPNVFKADELKTVLPVDSVNIKTYTVGSIPNPRPLINSFGDTIPTGVPIPAIGKRVPVKWPEPILALAPRHKDNATMDIKLLGVEQGLRSNSVESILQDNRGHFWFATNGGGATLYDGVSMWHFGEANGLTENSVYEIFEDSRGRIWFGTQRGLMYYDGKEFVQFNESDGYLNNYTHNIMEDREGNLWLGSWFYGLCKYDGETFTYYSEREGFPGLRILALLEDRNGAIWIGTERSGLFKFRGSAFTQFSFARASTENNEVSAIYEDARGNLWLGTPEGVYVYNGHQLTLYAKDRELEKMRKITEDDQGNLWLGSGEYGLTKYDGRNFTHITTEQGISSLRNFDIRIVDSGEIWIATSGGVNIYSPNSFQHPQALSNAAVRSVFQDSKGNLWFGTVINGVYKYDGQNYYNFTEEQGFFNRHAAIWAIEEDDKGNIWFGAAEGAGLIRYDGPGTSKTPGASQQGTFTHYYPKDGSASGSYRFVTNLVIDEHQALWIAFGGDGGGLLRFDGNAFEQFTTHEGLISNKMSIKMPRDHRGHLWVFTAGGGVTKIDPGIQPDDPVSLIHFSEKEGFTNNVVHSILPLPSGTVWLGDKSGSIYAYRDNAGSADSKMLTRLNLEGVRDQEQIESMVRDPQGGIWLSTHVGLDRLSIDSLASSDIAFSATSYGRQDGLRGLNFNRPVLLDDHNNIWWSTDKGITFLNAEEYKVPDRPPKIQLREIEVNNMKIDYRHFQDTLARGLTFDSVHHFSNIPFNLRIPYKLRSLTFHFSALDWYAPHQIRYSYSLEGLTKDWSAPTKNSHVSFQRLPHGDYMLKIRAKGISNQWSDTLSYSFVIYPPWWDTWWARMLYGIAAVGLVIGIVRQRTAVHKKRQKELEKIIEERTAAGKDKEKLLHTIGKRHKELKCMYTISNSIRTKESLDEIFQDTVDAIQPAWHYPEITRGKLKYNDKEWVSESFEETGWKQSSDIIINGRTLGSVEVYYLDERPLLDEGPFMKEERHLIDGIADSLSEAIERKSTSDKLSQSETKYRDLVDNAMVGVFNTTVDGQIAYVNEAIANMFDFDDIEQMLKTKSPILWEDPEQRKMWTYKLKKYGAVSNFEAETITHSGRKIHVLFSSKLGAGGITGMVMEITERKRAEQQILKYQGRLKDLAKELTITEEKVRKGIAVDLHDHVGQILASTRMQISFLHKIEDENEFAEKIESISETLRNAIQATREAIFNLSPPQLNEIGLHAAVHDWMKEQIEAKYNIRTNISEQNSPDDLDENTRLLLFRSIRELMMNVVKHARAKKMDVDIVGQNGALEITVSDDGKGFIYNPELIRLKSNSYGLFSIQERIDDLGGSMEVDSEIDVGTTIKLSIPLN